MATRRRPNTVLILARIISQDQVCIDREGKCITQVRDDGRGVLRRRQSRASICPSKTSRTRSYRLPRVVYYLARGQVVVTPISNTDRSNTKVVTHRLTESREVYERSPVLHGRREIKYHRTSNYLWSSGMISIDIR